MPKPSSLQALRLALQQIQQERDFYHQQSNETKGLLLALVRKWKDAAADAVVDPERTVEENAEQRAAALAAPIRITKEEWAAATDQAPTKQARTLTVEQQENGDVILNIEDAAPAAPTPIAEA